MPRQNMFQFLRSPSVVVLLVLLGAVIALEGAALVQRHRLAQPDYQLRRGEQAIQRKDWREVDAIAGQLLVAGFPDHANFLQGKAYLARGETRRALESLGRVREDSAVALAARLIEGEQIMEWAKDFGRAQAAFDSVLARDPDNVKAHWGLAVVYFDVFAWDDCCDECRRVAELDPDDGRPLSVIGLVSKERKRYAEAATAYSEALQRNLSDNRRVEVGWELAEVYLAQDDAARAQELLDRDTEPARSNYSHLVLEAECAWRKGDRDRAIETLDRALAGAAGGSLATSIGPSREAIRLIFYLLENGDTDKAMAVIKNFDRRLGNDPDFAAIRLRALRELKMDKETQEQKEKLEKLQAIRKEIDTLQDQAYADRKNNRVRRRLAGLWQQLGHLDLAEQWNVAGVAVVK